MLMLSSLSVVLISIVFKTNHVWFMFFVVMMELSLLQILNGFMQSGYLSLFVFDDLFYWLGLVTLLLGFFTYYSIGCIDTFDSGNGVLLSMSLLVVTCLFVFSSSSCLILYLAYEFSLLPIIYIISKWGVYPDRTLSASMMLMYTAVFSFPFMCVVIWWFMSLSSFSFFTISSVFSPLWVCISIFMAFAVKLPLYGLHHWLPMAHVEAPTFGSMILAGLLLKMGGCGLVRFWGLVGASPSPEFSLAVVSYCFICILLVSVITSLQSDMKRLVAYSSVIHMSVLVLLLMQFQLTSVVTFLVLMVSHAFSSPLMFLLTGCVYKFFSTRLLFFMRGVVIMSPLLGMLLTLGFFLNTPTPPFLGFLGEVLMFITFMTFSNLMALLVFGLVVTSLVYNLFWYISLTMSSMSSTIDLSNSLSYAEFNVSIVFGVYCFMMVFCLVLFC